MSCSMYNPKGYMQLSMLSRTTCTTSVIHLSSRGGQNSQVAKFAKFCNFGNLRIFAKFAKFCACYSAPCVLAKAAQFLVNLPVTSAEVERSFSLASYADNKYRHNLPNEARRLTNMLLFNGDVEGRFATA